METGKRRLAASVALWEYYWGHYRRLGIQKIGGLTGPGATSLGAASDQTESASAGGPGMLFVNDSTHIEALVHPSQ